MVASIEQKLAITALTRCHHEQTTTTVMAIPSIFKTIREVSLAHLTPRARRSRRWFTKNASTANAHHSE